MQNIFSDEQAITLAALEASTNLIDLGAPGITGYQKQQLNRVLGKGMTPLMLQVTETFTGVVTSMNIKFQQADDDAFTVNLEDVISFDVAVAELVAGYQAPIDKFPRLITRRYIRIAYTMNGTAATGKISAGVVGAVDGAYRGN